MSLPPILTRIAAIINIVISVLLLGLQVYIIIYFFNVIFKDYIYIFKYIDRSICLWLVWPFWLVCSPFHWHLGSNNYNPGFCCRTHQWVAINKINIIDLRINFLFYLRNHKDELKSIMCGLSAIVGIVIIGVFSSSINNITQNTSISASCSELTTTCKSKIWFYSTNK